MARSQLRAKGKARGAGGIRHFSRSAESKRARRRTQQQRREATRRKLLDAAADAIARRGLAEASIEAISKEAGVTSGAVQHHFGTRNDLLLAVVDDFGQRLFTPLPAAEAAPKTLAQRVEAVCAHYWRIFSDRYFLAVIQIWLGAKSELRLYRTILDRIRWFEVEFDRQWIERFLDSSIAPKQLSAARHVALATMRGLALRMTYSARETQSFDELEVLKAMLRLYLTVPK